MSGFEININVSVCDSLRGNRISLILSSLYIVRCLFVSSILIIQY